MVSPHPPATPAGLNPPAPKSVPTPTTSTTQMLTPTPPQTQTQVPSRPLPHAVSSISTPTTSTTQTLTPTPHLTQIPASLLISPLPLGRTDLSALRTQTLLGPLRTGNGSMTARATSHPPLPLPTVSSMHGKLVDVKRIEPKHAAGARAMLLPENLPPYPP